MKKKILTLSLAVCLAATAIVGGTLAYFTDIDADVNVMTTGNVKIVQNEEQRDDEGKAEAFKNDKMLIPAVYNGTLSYDGTFIATNGDTYSIWNESVNNEVDKFITVTNNGSRPAYVRTIIAFEDNAAGELTTKLHTLWGDVNGTGKYEETTAMADADGVIENLPYADVVWLQNNDGSWMTITDSEDVTYTLCVVTYQNALDAKDTTIPSLKQLFLDPTAGNEWSEAVGTQYTIRAISQAIQSEGFDTVNEAMDSTFVLTQANLQSWFDTYSVKTDSAKNTIIAGQAD